MGTTSSTVLTADHQVKIYRQLQDEQRRLTTLGSLSDGEVYQALKTKHDNLVNLYSTETFQCPKVRFGRTELQMPILTCGGMRMQETWMPKEGTTLEMISKECQANFEKIIMRSMQLGINHFETARGYGTSEIQFAPILKKFPRADYILQTKVVPDVDPEAFRKKLLTSFESLGIDLNDPNSFVDLLSFHGINKPEHIKWVVESNLAVVKEYQKAGKVRFIGFSTHAPTTVIEETIETGLFDYVNLHYQFIGSYTASGTGCMGGNLSCLHLAQKHDMGVFIISPTDKGGGLYEPPRTFTEGCLPLTPIAFNNLFLWAHDPPIHTIVIGTARPSDFDEHIESAMLYSQRHTLVPPIQARLYQMVEDKLGEKFLSKWYVDLPDCYHNSEYIPIGGLYWLWWIVKVWGFYHFALKRYTMIEGNVKAWNEQQTIEDKLKTFSWVPGLPYRKERDEQIKELLKEKPDVYEAIKEMHEWLREGGCLARGEVPQGVDTSGWQLAYDLQPNKPFPERN